MLRASTCLHLVTLIAMITKRSWLTNQLLSSRTNNSLQQWTLGLVQIMLHRINIQYQLLYVHLTMRRWPLIRRCLHRTWKIRRLCTRYLRLMVSVHRNSSIVLVGQMYLPPFNDCRVDFMSQLIQGKKLVSVLNKRSLVHIDQVTSITFHIVLHQLWGQDC